MTADHRSQMSVSQIAILHLNLFLASSINDLCGQARRGNGRDRGNDLDNQFRPRFEKPLSHNLLRGHQR
ncbi:hypothetical protein [Rhizobium sp. S163]|uniref:hypothetical protein n=1 Tax=Rhizobium sp. S163 TaxID=3055039 RepID=UPI0025AA090F|nr:hypothetical protein [Rhizobium sp. S163]MDM9646838.1 hypothetical protein [Rhizobium sp. S163]